MGRFNAYFTIWRTGDDRRKGWTGERFRVAAAQLILDKLGFEPGAVDGFLGRNTQEAITDFLSKQAIGFIPQVLRIPLHESASPSKRYPLQRDLEAFYGEAGGPACTAGTVELPFAFRIAWDKDTKISRFKCHEKLVQPFTQIWAETAKNFGESAMRAMGLDLYGGCYNYRKMRGGKSLSVHASGAAQDVDPERNQLRWGSDRALLARPEYDAFWAIVAAAGAVSLGRVAGFDYMHFQFARLS